MSKRKADQIRPSCAGSSQSSSALTSWALITGLGNTQAVALSTANKATVFFDVAKIFVGDFFYKIVRDDIVIEQSGFSSLKPLNLQ